MLLCTAQTDLPADEVTLKATDSSQARQTNRTDGRDVDAVFILFLQLNLPLLLQFVFELEFRKLLLASHGSPPCDWPWPSLTPTTHPRSQCPVLECATGPALFKPAPLYLTIDACSPLRSLLLAWSRRRPYPPTPPSPSKTSPRSRALFPSVLTFSDLPRATSYEQEPRNRTHEPPRLSAVLCSKLPPPPTVLRHFCL